MLHSLIKPLRDMLLAFRGADVYLGPRTAEAVSMLEALAPDVLWLRPETLAAADGDYGKIMISPALRRETQIEAALKAAAGRLRSTGAVLMVVHRESPDPAGVIQIAGLRIYGRHESDSAPGDVLLVLVGPKYSPASHARELGAESLHAEAARWLESVPNGWFRHAEDQWEACAEAQRQYLALCDQLGPEQADLALLGFAQKHFYTAIYHYPARHEPYRLQAELWSRFGRSDMACRVLRSIQHHAPEMETAHDLELLGEACSPPTHISVPEPHEPNFAPRILILTHDYSDYGLDTLYDGLCQVLGSDHVVEFPWKPTLHGQRTESAHNYPCVFDYPGGPRAASAIEDELRAGMFDLILMADVVQHAYRDVVRGFLAAGSSTPVVVYDTWDNPHNLLPSVLIYLGRSDVLLQFKREMVAGINYGFNTRPLPFGYPDRLVPKSLADVRPRDLFWAGKRLYGMRPLYLERLAPKYGFPLEPTFSQEEYARAIGEAQIGLSFFGFGFDTVRYWELPAHGAMLLSERPPIHIPYDFVDGETAVFFDDLAELEAKLEYYLARPEVCARIAAAGRCHFLAHHTSSARAHQFLGQVQAAIAGGYPCTMTP